MRVINRYIHYTAYGIDITYDTETGIYTADIGGIVYRETSYSQMLYIIQCLQVGIGVIH